MDWGERKKRQTGDRLPNKIRICKQLELDKLYKQVELAE